MEEINKCMDKFFPKGKDKRRGDALVLQAVAYIEGKKEEKEKVLGLIDKWYIKTREKKTYVDLSDVQKLKDSIKGESK